MTVNPDLFPLDFLLFSNIKVTLKGRIFEGTENIRTKMINEILKLCVNNLNNILQ